MDPTTAWFGAGSACTVIVELDDGQLPTLVSVHFNTLGPTEKLPAVADWLERGPTVPPPDSTDHDGTPVVKLPAANWAVAVLMQIVWLGPA